MKLPYRPPFAWDALLGFFSRRAIRGVEWCDADSYARTVRAGGASGVIRIAHDAARYALVLTLPRELQPHRAHIAAKVRAMFDLDADPAAIAQVFANDPLLRDVHRAHPGVRVPGAWDPFEIAIRAIVGQQISVAGAITLLGRITAHFGEAIGDDARLFPTPAALASAELTGMPRSRIETIRAVARAFPNLDGIRGVGPWTKSYLAMRTSNDRDAFPSGDLVLRKSAGVASARELERRAEAWRPYRAYATILLWMR